MKLLFCAFIILLTVISAPAGEITVSDNPATNLTSIGMDNSTFRPIKYCKNGQCELIPDEKTLLLQEFSEKDMAWAQIFNQCRNFKSLNQLTLWTEIISSIVVTIKPITLLRNLRATKNILAGWGLFGRIVGKRIVFDTGIIIAGQVVYFLPATALQLENGSPYPEIQPEDVELLSNLMEDIISDSQDVYYLPEAFIEGIAALLKGCTSQLKQDYISQNVKSTYQSLKYTSENIEKTCSACHSTKSRSKPTTRTAPKTPQTMDPSLKMDIEKQKLIEYLQNQN